MSIFLYRTDTETLTLGRLPADVRNRLKGHANCCEEHLWILWSNLKLTASQICSIMSSQFEIADTHLNMQGAEATIADLKHHITTHKLQSD
jgi:hypothetical protein